MFKYLKLTVLAGITAMALTGCGSYQPQLGQHFQEGDVIAEKQSNGSYTFVAFPKDYSSFTTSGAQNHKEFAGTVMELKEASHFGKHMGYKYFALVTGDKFNNVMGTPINTLDSYLKHCYSLKMGVNYVGDCRQSKINVFYFKEHPKQFPVWSIDKTINDKVDLSKMWDDKKYNYHITKQDLKDYFTKRNIPFSN
ncbi:hypothetical protein ALC152_05000 [Arcobacter sp. 15-2]|uniref:hypothetical protein n=1 Tax=Arcobacter sp. 15-2 TaxID=3374109 RepID=UPI00399D3E37